MAVITPARSPLPIESPCASSCYWILTIILCRIVSNISPTTGGLLFNFFVLGISLWVICYMLHATFCRILGAGHLFRYVTNQPPKANSAFHPFGVSKWVPAWLGRQRQVWFIPLVDERGVCLLWYPLRTRAIPARLRVVITTRRYTNPRLPYLTLPY